jgi:hypothetical protein
MEVVLFLILFVIFILMIVTLSSLSDIKSKVEKLDAKVSGQFIALREELSRLRQGDELPKKATPVVLHLPQRLSRRLCCRQPLRPSLWLSRRKNRSK